ncbi:MAG: hypothetical protein HZB27_04175 [Meiothermus silvanus]|nr:hypothetical protein [Allomeiothermus silvanus]
MGRASGFERQGTLQAPLLPVEHGQVPAANLAYDELQSIWREGNPERPGAHDGGFGAAAAVAVVAGGVAEGILVLVGLDHTAVVAAKGNRCGEEGTPQVERREVKLGHRL